MKKTVSLIMTLLMVLCSVSSITSVFAATNKEIVKTELCCKNYEYTGKKITPYILVKDSNDNYLSEDEDYTVKFKDKSISIGKHTVELTFSGKYYVKNKNKYVRKQVISYNIIPKGTSIKSAQRMKKYQIKINWKAQKNQTTGYQLQCSTDKNFKKIERSIVFNNNKKTSTVLGKFKNNKKYYFRIRTYKAVKTDNGKKKNYYSCWRAF